MKYNNKDVIQLLDADTIAALLKLYDIQYKHVAARLNCTRQAIVYLIKNDRFKDYQKEIILEMLLQRGIEIAELMLFHQMIKKSKKGEII